MKSLSRLAALALLAGFATPAFAEMVAPAAPASKIDAGDTAWMIAATALVLMMTIPGLALFYCGMVRKKNVLGTMAQSVAAVCIVSILWALLGYTLAFSGDAPALLGRLHAALDAVGNWDAEALEDAVRRVADDAGVKLGQVAQPLRAALTGRKTSPGIFDVLELLGREESLGRIADRMTG